ncbi:MAG: hemolysin family protein [Micrococcales bacterium]
MIAVAVIIALLAIPVAIVESGLRRALQADLAESWGLIRIVLTALFALVIGQLLEPRGLLWWVNIVVAVILALLMVFVTQLAAKWLSHRRFGQALMTSLDPLVRQVNLAFTPLTGPKIEDHEEFEQELMDSVEEFTETIAREIMVPRIDIDTVESDSTISDAMKVFLRTGYSRLPVTGKNIDDILGVLYLKDAARISFERAERLDQPVTSAMRPAIFVPEFIGVDDLLKHLQAVSTHMAMVIDEYGGVAGLVTMEDVIEEIVGEIKDEYDRDLPDVEDLGERRYLVNARYSLVELGEIFNIELEEEDVDSVGGLVVKELGRLAVVGDSVEYSGLRLTVKTIEKRRKRVTSLLVEPTAKLSDVQAGFESEE